MNYLKQITAFTAWKEVNQLPAIAIALWHELMAISNRHGWPSEITVSNVLLAIPAGLSRKRCINARMTLIQKELITYRKSNKVNEAGTYTIFPISIVSYGTQEGTQEGHTGGHATAPLSNKNKQNNNKERELVVRQLVRAYEETFGVLKGDPSRLMTLIDYMDKGMELELVVTAIHKFSNADVPLKYADTILANQLCKGIKTVVQATQETAAGGTTFERSIDKGARAAPRQNSGRTQSLTNGQTGRIRRPQVLEMS